MNESNSNPGFYRAESHHPAGDVRSALSIGRIGRHYDHGFMFIRGRGRVSLAAAMQDGLIDQAAADIIAAQESCVGRPMVFASLPPPQRRKAPFEDTPTGALIDAIRSFIQQPTNEDTTRALGEALKAHSSAMRATAP